MIHDCNQETYNRNAEHALGYKHRGIFLFTHSAKNQNVILGKFVSLGLCDTEAHLGGVDHGELAVVEVGPVQNKPCCTPERIQDRVQVRVPCWRSHKHLSQMHRHNHQQVQLMIDGK